MLASTKLLLIFDMHSTKQLYIFSFVIALCGFFVWINQVSDEQSHHSWLLDKDFAKSNKNILCNIQIVEHLQLEDLQRLQSTKLKPFIIRGLAKTWKASSKWAFENFTATYGRRLVKTGSESSIVYGGGIAGIPKSINSLLSDLRLLVNSLFCFILMFNSCWRCFTDPQISRIISPSMSLF